MSKKNRRISVGVRVFISSFVIIFAAMLLLCAVSYTYYRKSTLDSFYMKSHAIVTSFASGVDVFEIEDSVRNWTQNDYWYSLKMHADRAWSSNNITYLYAIAKDPDGVYRYYFDSENRDEKSSEFNEIAELDEFDPAIFTHFEAGESYFSNTMDTSFGTLIGAYTPVINRHGEPLIYIGAEVDVNTVVAQYRTFGLIMLLGCLVTSLIFAYMLSRYQLWLIDFFLSRITFGAKGMVDGDFDFYSRGGQRSDAISRLYTRFAKVVKSFRMMSNDLHELTVQHEQGAYDSRVDETAYEGVYLEIVRGINDMVSQYSHVIDDLLDTVRQYGMGEFKANIRKYPGKLGRANETIDHLRERLTHVSEEIAQLSKHAIRGNLRYRAKSEDLFGHWEEIITSLNFILDTIASPVDEVTEVITQLKEGNLHALVTGNYAGQFHELKLSLNATSIALNTYVSDIKSALSRLADYDLNVTIETDYPGDFIAIKDSINAISGEMNEIMSTISGITGGLHSVVQNLETTSQNNASNVAYQSDSLNHLRNALEDVNKQIEKSASFTSEANILSKSSKKNADHGNKVMSTMLSSMEELNTSTEDILKIISLIDGIAFQTNLLALNASVEAARAGEHGKSFVTVADEVRNLAGRTAIASKDIKKLIAQNVKKIGKGTEIAQTTSDILEKIVSDVTGVSQMVSNISSASQVQTGMVQEITNDILHISKMVTETAAIADDDAQMAKKLSEQSTQLNGLVAEFKMD